MQTMAKMLIVLLLGCLLGCGHIVFVSDRADMARIYRSDLFSHSLRGVTPFSDSLYPETFPDVSPDAARVAFIRKKPTAYELVARRLGGANEPEAVLYSTANSLATPRWTCQQDVVAFAQYITSGQAAVFSIRSDGTAAAPVQITHPPANRSDSGGHDFFDNGNRIVFARSGPTGGSWDLYVARSDGTGGETAITQSANIHEILPVISHNQQYLAYLIYVPLAPGTMETIVLARVGEWSPIKQIQLQAPVGGRRIRALAFSEKDDALFVAAVVPEVQAASQDQKVELFEVTGIWGETPGIHRLTENVFWDSQPDAVPQTARPLCTRCADIRNQGAAPTAPAQVVNGVRFQSAKLPSGADAGVSIEDYSSPRDGVNEVKIGWSQTDQGPAAYAAILFPPELFGRGPSAVDVTAFHYNSCRLKAFNSEGALLSEVQHTAGQRVQQTLSLTGQGISKIEVIGAEIGIVEVCYRR